MKTPTETAPLKDIVRIYMTHAKRHGLLMALVFVGTVGAQVCAVIIPIFLARFFNEIVAGASVGALYWTLSIIAMLFGAQWFARRVFGISIVLFETRTMHDLYLSAYKYMMRHSQQFFSTQFSGTLTRRVSKYVTAFESLFDSIAITFTPTFLFITGAVTVLSLRHPVLGLALGVWSVIFLTFQLVVSHYRQPIRIQRAEADSRVVGGLADAITNQHSINIFARMKHEFSLFSSLVTRWKEATLRSWIIDEYIWAAQGFLMFTIQLGLLFGALNLWQQGKLEVGDFVLIQVYILGIIDNLVGIGRELRRVYDASADAGEMVAILNTPHAIADVPDAKPLVVQDASIHFKSVDFRYRNASNQVLNGFELHIRAGERVGVVGKSGAGKSTLTKLLLRHYDIVHGQILIDGQDISKVTQDSLHESIAVVPQESMLFHRTLSENISYGKIDATDEEIQAAATSAQAHDFIAQMQYGYETLVGERGIKLSGGERQRVAIARAILKDAPILVLDEATASLDSESEVAIQHALQELMRGKTVVAIAHRLSTLREMDRIIVLDSGRIVEEGSHEQLLEHGGIYADLWRHQAGGFLKDD